MIKKSKYNPMSYLGWLGWIGIIGINTGDFLLQCFVIYFFFFLYKYKPADELFWQNVRRASFITFMAGGIWGNILIITIVVITRIGETIQNVGIVYKLGIASFFLLICLFIGIMMHYNHQDKKYLED